MIQKGKEMKKIVMACGDGMFNLGDEAIIASFLPEIKKQIKNHDKNINNKKVKIKVFSSNNKKTKELHNINSIKLDISVKGLIKNIPSIIKNYSKMDLLVWGGGNLISDGSSILYTPFHLIKIILAKLLGKKVAVYGIGVGPLNGWFVKTWTRLILNNVELITVRDENSKKLLRKAGVKKKIYVTADPAFCLEAINRKQAIKKLEKEGIVNNFTKNNSKQPLIAIVPRRVFHRKSKSIIPVKYKVKFGMIDKKSKNKFKKFVNDLSKTADFLVEKYNAKIVFIPMQMISAQEQEDHKISKEIIKKMQHKENAVIINSYNYSSQELKAVYGLMKLIIGIRFHSIVLGSSMNVPVVSLPYSLKGKRLTKLLELEKYSLNVEDVSYSALVSKINMILKDEKKVKKGLKKKIEILQAKSKFNVKLIARMLQ